MQRIVGHDVNVESVAHLDGIPKIRNILRVEESGLLLFALAVLVVGGVLIGQALARAVSAGAADLPTWRAIGADRSIAVTRAGDARVDHRRRRRRRPARPSRSLLSARFPISQARRFDLHVGYHADWFVLGARRARRAHRGDRDRDSCRRSGR